MIQNLAHEWVKRSGMTVEAARESWDGSCIDFAGDFSDAIGRGRMAYFDGLPMNMRWKYHCAVEIDGFVHCLWEDRAWPLAEYMERIGAASVEYPAEETAEEERL